MLASASGNYYQILNGEYPSWLSLEELDAQGEYKITENISLETLSQEKSEVARIRHSAEENEKLIYNDLYEQKLVQEAQSGWFPVSLLSGVAHQVTTAFNSAVATTQTLTSVLYKAKQATSELGLFNTLRLGTRTLLDPSARSGVVALGFQYKDYKEKIKKGQQSHLYVQEDQEKRLEYLHKKGSKRTESETSTYKELLASSYELENQKIAQQFRLATRILQHFEQEATYPLDPDISTREHIQKQIEQLLRTRHYGDGSHSLNIDDYSVIEMVVSKILLKNNSALLKESDEPDARKNIGILIPVHKEHNRLKPKSQCYTGEDFLARKLQQLEFLFEGIENIDWHVTFVEDQAKADSKHRSIDEINKRLREDKRILHLSSKVTCLDYAEDLHEEQEAYKNRELSTISADDLARKSVKGAAVHLGMRYLVQACNPSGEKKYKSPKADVVFSTDADLSINLAGIGLEIDPILRKQKHASIGSRRIQNSHVYGRSQLRELQSFLFNQLVRASLNIQLSDTQVGAKAFSAEMINDIHKGFDEISMAFDPEIIRLMKDFQISGAPKYSLGLHLEETGRVWRDSALESQSAGQSMNMFAGLRSISQRVASQHKAPEKGENLVTSASLLEKLSTEGECFTQLMQLANDDRFRVIADYFNEIYTAIAPQEIKKLMVDSHRLFTALATNSQDSEAIIRTITEDLTSILSNMDASDYLGFILDTFPEAYAIGELLQRDPNYIRVIIPLLLGDDNPLNLLVGFKDEPRLPLKDVAFDEVLIGKVNPRAFIVETVDDLTRLDALSQSEERIIIDNMNRVLLITGGKKYTFEGVHRYNLPMSSNTQLTELSESTEKTQLIEQVINLHKTNTYRGQLQAWQLSKAPKKPDKERVFKSMNEERLAQNQEDLKTINEKASEKIKVGIVLNYNSDSTSKAYIDKNIQGKIEALKAAYGHLENIEFHFIVVDTRPKDKCTSKIDEYIDSLLTQTNEAGINCTGSQVHFNPPPGAQYSKAEAVKFGMDYGIETQKCNIVGYVDFSDKIHIEEIGAAISQICHEGIEKGSLAIGSRRLEESDVENKPIIPLLQSSFLNLFIKSMYPRLFHLSDSQTGFKFFSQSAWEAIRDKNPQDNSMGFDIELLQIAAKCGFTISEFPVDFFDSRQNEMEYKTQQQTSIFQGLIEIRGRLDDSFYGDMKPDETRLLGCGAENMVFRLSNGSIIKIPHEALGDDFFTILKNVIFKDRQATTIDAQQETLKTAGVLNQIMAHPVIQQNMAALRNWKELNAFVMRVISAVENKSYKAIGYETSLRFGKDLIIPFKMIDHPIKLNILGQERIIEGYSNVKQSVPVSETFGDRFYERLKGVNPESDLDEQMLQCEQIDQLFDEAIGLFDKLWERGLFDLDTNFMRDTGYYPSSSTGDSTLMSLDPGEIIDDLRQLDVEAALKKLTERADFQEIKAAVNSSKLHPEVKTRILEAYTRKLETFFNRVVKPDVEAVKQKREPTRFGIERFGMSDLTSFAIQFPERLNLPIQELAEVDQAHLAKREAFKLSKYGYQKPFIKSPPLKTEPQTLAISRPFLHTITQTTSVPLDPHPKESKQCTEIGSILPLMMRREMDKEAQQDIIVLDGGSASRSSLLKFATPDQAKGEVQISGQCSYVYAASVGDQILTALNPSLNVGDEASNYVVMMSGDDYLELNETSIERLKNYFATDPAPGMYWVDLPNAGKDFFPMTQEQTLEFLRKNEEELIGLIRNFTEGIPFLKGFSDEGLIEMFADALQNSFDNYKKLRPDEQKLAGGSKESYKAQLSSIAPLLAPAIDYYKQYLIFHATKELGGPKTPFLMVFRKEFLDEFHQEIVKPLLAKHAYIMEDITWENLLIRGFKADKTIWQSMGKPPQLPMEVWNEIYDKLQILKTKWNIDVDDVQQNEQRVFHGFWHNLDDPMSVLHFLEHRFSSMEQHRIIKEVPHQSRGLKVISDSCLPDNLETRIQSSVAGTLGLLNCDLSKGQIKIANVDSTVTPLQNCTNLFYDIRLEEGQELVALPNHLVVAIEGNIFSVPMQMINKADLKTLPVFYYEQNGDKQFNPVRVATLATMPHVCTALERIQEEAKQGIVSQNFKARLQQVLHEEMSPPSPGEQFNL
ncbi:hypothetical protein [Legionella massiliensis]|nr:hypothetical protein [Legionella massiliensis]